MVKIPEYKPKSGVTTAEVSPGEHEATIKDIGIKTMQRPMRKWDDKLKAKVVVLDDYGNEIMEDYDVLEFSYEITDVPGNYVVTGLTSFSMNPGDEQGRMRSHLYTDAMLLGEVPKKGKELDTDRFLRRAVLIKVIGNRRGDTEWANAASPIVSVLDGGSKKQASFEDDARDSELV